MDPLGQICGLLPTPHHQGVHGARAIDVRPNLSPVKIGELLQPWDLVGNIRLHDEEDSFQWNWEPSAVYSSRSTYATFHVGLVSTPTREQI